MQREEEESMKELSALLKSASPTNNNMVSAPLQ